MYTYQDYLKVPNNDKERALFVKNAISKHQSGDLYKTAVIAKQYFEFKNVTIMEYQKLLYTVTGKAIPDNVSANYKLRSNYFYRFVTQEVQHLLGNGISWSDATTKDKLGTKKKPFDTQLKGALKNAIIGAVSFGFWNNDHVDVFSVDEFVPIYDEENGSLRMGIRFWQLNNEKPLRATLYEEDGYTGYIYRDGGDGEIYTPKRAYKISVAVSEADGSEIYDEENYDSFPIVPMFNVNKTSGIEGLRENIDCYDLIKSGFANTVDEASYIYWAIQNAGGMDDVDLATFVERMRNLHAAIVEDENARAEAHTIEAPYQSREALLQRLRGDLYEDAMAVDIKNIADGAVTATQIKAAYTPLNYKTDDIEWNVIDFVNSILELAGIDDYATFTRSEITNKQEEIQCVVSSASVLPADYVTEKVVTLLGDGDRLEDILKAKDEEEMNRYEEGQGENTGGEDTEELGEESEQGI